ncbi:MULTISPECIES: hypothetical protein [Micromonospora]|uniref:Uncharacterized protein n=1 Tax=Micromonospora chalcea TaxID=1874 RepID=A0ABX9XWQ9_MICCH|nr:MULTISPECIES: hypothetical protein [Micromonospora]ODB75132.1 hypothetical protein A8711_08785 [Micromonospora sp. II]RQW87528.1 hypothetical protein DLJ60_26045 [Micromonospora chalcea]RQX30537.1 hypothetical protein DLJ57_20930 [Micromonospora chalcea]
MSGRRPDLTFEAACRAIEDAFVTLIPDAVARLVVDGPAACIALSYYPIGRAVLRGPRGH